MPGTGGKRINTLKSWLIGVTLIKIISDIGSFKVLLDNNEKQC
jgi:hypothetical protein